MSVHIVYQHSVDEKWRDVSHFFHKTFRRIGGIEVGELWQMCRTGQAFLLIALDENKVTAAAIFQFRSDSKGQFLRCISLGGSRMDDWLGDGLKLVNVMMREGGARRLTFDGRKGWERVLKPIGAAVTHVCYEVEL